MSTHIGAKKGDIAKGILLPGDPLRAKYIADNFLKDAKCFNEVRGMYGFTGEWKGKRISVMGTGMGIPSISIYVNELMRDYDVDYLCRVGTCGCKQPDMGLEDIILAQGACTTSDFNRTVFPGTYCPVADFLMLRTAYLKSKELGYAVRVGNVLADDMYYGEPEVVGDPMWAKYGVLAAEMETAALYTYAKKYKKSALSIVTVSDSPFTDRQLTTQEREQNLGRMIELALDTVAEFLD